MTKIAIWTERVAVVAALAAPGGLAAQETPPDPSLASLLAEAQARNPELLAATKSAESAGARVPQAGALPDPVLGVGLINFPYAEPSFRREMMTMANVQLGEEFPFPGKLRLREDVARFQAQAAEWETERVRQKVLTEVKAAYYEIYFVDRALEITGQNETLVADFARLTSAKYAVGTGVQPDVLKAQVEQTRLDDQLVALREQRTSAVAQVNALLSRPTDTPLPSTRLPEGVQVAALAEGEGEVTFTSASLAKVVPNARNIPAPGIPSVAELQRLALEHNPMIQAHVRRIAAQQHAVSLAEKAKLPDFDVTAAYSWRPAFTDFVSVMVSIPLPVFAGRKQDQAVAEQVATLAEQQATHHAMVNDVNGEIAALAAELQRARDQLVLLNDGILPQARTSLASSTASYQVGQVDFLALLDAQVTLYRHELEYHRLLADFATNLAALERAAGTEVLQ
ncbi:MAG: TolC family protein [Longimicrobiales bacterium]